MRVALFFDGKNFYSGWRDQTGRQPLDFVKLSQWLVTASGGTRLWAAHYYTGVESGSEAESPGQHSLARFLDWLDEVPGYFVQRFSRRPRTMACEHCGTSVRYTEEKEVDTTLVADMVRLAAINAYDIAVLISGDGDFGSALDAVRALGRQTYVATWGSLGLSNRLRRAAFDRLNLLDGLDGFSREHHPHVSASHSASVPHDAALPEPPQSPSEGSPEGLAEGVSEVPSEGQPTDGEGEPVGAVAPPGDLPADLQSHLEELKRAEAWFTERGRFLGANYFVTRWQSDHLPMTPDKRREQLRALETLGRIEFYTAPSGDAALRTR